MDHLQKKLIAEYSQLLDAYETYAQILGFTSIKFRIFTDTNCLWKNPMSIFRDFEQNIDTATYSKEDSELIKLAILIKKGYFLTESSTKHFEWTQMYVKQINKHTVPLKQLELDFKSKKRRSFRSASSK